MAGAGEGEEGVLHRRLAGLGEEGGEGSDVQEGKTHPVAQVGAACLRRQLSSVTFISGAGASRHGKGQGQEKREGCSGGMQEGGEAFLRRELDGVPFDSVDAGGRRPLDRGEHVLQPVPSLVEEGRHLWGLGGEHG